MTLASWTDMDKDEGRDGTHAHVVKAEVVMRM